MEMRALHSPNLTAHNVERIAGLFPQVMTESRDAEGNVTLAVDFDLLRQELSEHVVEGPKERYQLNWPGKRAAAFAANAPIAKTLRPVRAESADFNTTKNLPQEDIDALDRLQKGLSITDEAVLRLRVGRLVEGQRPHLRVSQDIAKLTGKLPDYLRKKPQADSHYSKLVLDLIPANLPGLEVGHRSDSHAPAQRRALDGAEDCAGVEPTDQDAQIRPDQKRWKPLAAGGGAGLMGAESSTDLPITIGQRQLSDWLPACDSLRRTRAVVQTLMQIERRKAHR